MSSVWARYTQVAPMLLAATAVMLGVAALGLNHIPEAWRGLALGLIAAGLFLYYACSPHEETPPRRAHAYFAAQTVLFGTLLVFAPTGRAQFSLPFFIIGSQAMMFFPLRTSILWLGIFVAVTGGDFIWVSGVPNGLIEFFPFLSGYFFLGIISYLWTQTDAARRKSQTLLAELETAHAQLRQSAARIEELAVADERNRIAREIHDTLGHTLTALDVQLELLVRLPPEKNGARQQAAGNARQLVKQGLADVRRAVQALRPVALETFSLPEAIGALVQDFRRTTGVAVTWRVTDDVDALPTRFALPLYRAAQEALTNIQRHAPTTPRVTMQLEDAPNTIRLCVENAPPREPPDPAHTGGRVGLAGLRERARALGGTFRAEPTPAGGFTVEMTLPKC